MQLHWYTGYSKKNVRISLPYVSISFYWWKAKHNMAFKFSSCISRSFLVPFLTGGVKCKTCCRWRCPLLRWPPQPPGMTPCDFFLWGYVKDMVYVPPLLRLLQDLWNRTSNAVETIIPVMLQRVCQEVDYRIDVCQLMEGAHIEALRWMHIRYGQFSYWLTHYDSTW
jgi:hypothetical protein